ncbi:MAG TPA: hypothetical protein PKD91_05025, partial [Bacteroidia bacterium]|nr:hypothetical protein [Bacteroidia bacterium]
YSITNYYNNAGEDHHSGISPNAMVRLFAGYNSARSAVSLTFTDNKVALASENKSRATIRTGNFRINFVRRFAPGPKTTRFLKRTPLFK